MGFGFAQLGQGFLDGEGLFAVFAGVFGGRGLRVSKFLCFRELFIIRKHVGKVKHVIAGPFLVGVDLLVKLFADIFEVVRFAPVMLVSGLLFILISF